MMAMRHILIVLFVIHCLVAEDKHDDHDDHKEHGHEEHESLVKKCEEGGGRYCFLPGQTDPKDHCFKDDSKYCECTEKGLNQANTNVKWDQATKACVSDVRKECFKYKANLYAYYRGKCFEQKSCLAEAAKEKPITWLVKNDVASCEFVEGRCAKLDSAEWEKDDNECHCEKEGYEFHNDHCHGKEKVDNAKKWGYGIIATAIISAFAVFGVLIVLMRHQWWYSYLLSTMVALAMGCLLSDATLHLIPLSLGLHSHDEEGHEGHDHHGEEEKKMSATQIRNITIGITVGVYIFLLFEKAIQLVMPHHSHSHGGDAEVHVNPAADTEMKESKMPSVNEPDDLEMKDSKPVCNRERSYVDHLHEEDVITRDGGICSVDSVAWMVIIGDALHNFADGLVMGAAFTNSLATGLGTSIAVLCHEIPHELGDFAVLLNAGMKIKFAVLFNFLSALTCFLGLIVGFAIGANEDAQKWIFAFTAGMFIYIACADLIPLMNAQCKTSKHPAVTLLLQQLGIIVGFLIMWILALYEEDIENVGQPHEH